MPSRRLGAPTPPGEKDGLLSWVDLAEAKREGSVAHALVRLNGLLFGACKQQVWRQLLSNTSSSRSHERHFTFDRQEARDALALAGAAKEAAKEEEDAPAAAAAISRGPSAEGGAAVGGGGGGEAGKGKSAPRPLLVQLYEQMAGARVSAATARRVGARSDAGHDDATPLDVSSLHQGDGRAFHVSFNNERGQDAGACSPRCVCLVQDSCPQLRVDPAAYLPPLLPHRWAVPGGPRPALRRAALRCTAAAHPDAQLLADDRARPRQVDAQSRRHGRQGAPPLRALRRGASSRGLSPLGAGAPS